MTTLPMLLAAGLLLMPVWAGAQSLADAARAEEARRKTIPTPSRLYTNADLKADLTGALVAPGDVPVSMGAAGDVPAEPSTQVPAINLPGGTPEPAPAERDQAYWSGRISAARAAVERSRVLAEALQSRINALSTDFVNRDDPAQRAQIELERQRALAELDRMRQEMADQTQAIADIEEEARKAGVPAGWLRQN